MDIIVTSPCDEEFWEEEPDQNWSPWIIKGSPPKDFTRNDRLWVVWCDYIRGYFTVKKLNIDDFKTKTKILLDKWFILSEPIFYKGFRKFRYFYDKDKSQYGLIKRHISLNCTKCQNKCQILSEDSCCICLNTAPSQLCNICYSRHLLPNQSYNK